MQIEIYKTTAGFTQLAPEWDRLVQRSRANYVFMTSSWQRTWWEQLGSGELCIIAVRNSGGHLVGLAPLFSGRDQKFSRTLNMAGWEEVSDYLDWVVAPADEREIYAALLEALLTHRDVPGWEALSLCNIPQDSPTLRILPELARRRGLLTEQSVDDLCPIISLPATWEEYLAQLTKKQRHELRRKLRRGSGLHWYRVGSQHDLEIEIARFIELMEKSSADKAAFIQNPGHRAFFQAAARGMAEQGWLQLNFLTDGERPVATFFNLVYNNRVHIYNSGFDPVYAAQSPGIVLCAHIIRQAIESGCAVVDFMRGTEGYKYDLGGIDTTVHRLRLVRVRAGRIGMGNIEKSV